jgi:ABC-type glycerol-3-phosphate transport system permease component
VGVRAHWFITVVLLLAILLVALPVLLVVLLQLLLERNVASRRPFSTVLSSVPARFTLQSIRAFGLEIDM